MQEVWKDIVGYEGLYQVSNLGRVKRIFKNNKERVLKCKLDRSGYLRANLRKNNISKHHSVHRLVAKAFIENPDNLPQVNHKDEIKINNNANNLEWCTQKYNIVYSIAKKVLQYDLEGNFMKEWISLSEASRQLNIRESQISKCCRGKINKTGGYKWKFKD